MKKNTATNREVPFPEGKFIVSKTDLKGIITQVNDVFVDVSGFSRDELIGKNHNIVRHPDMPPAAFRWLWDTLHAGMPWTGIVKNRCKNGDHYWVEAVVAPIKENGQVTGYTSIRNKPTREQVATVEALYPTLFSINKLPTPLLKRLPAMTISRKVWLLSLMSAVFIAVGTFTGLHEIGKVNAIGQNVLQNEMDPAWRISRVLNLMSDNRSESFASVQHDPSHKFFSVHEHKLDLHIERIEKNITDISTMFAEIDKTPFSVEERTTYEQFKQARREYVEKGLKPTLEHLKAGRFDEANLTVLKGLNPTYIKAVGIGLPLMENLREHAAKGIAENLEAYELTRMLFIAGGAFGIFTLLLTSWLTIRRMSAGLSETKRLFERMAEGKLADKADIDRRDEIGDLNRSLTVMQVQLKAMLDDIKDAAQQIDDRSNLLSSEMKSVADASVEQSNQAHSMAASAEEFGSSVAQVAETARGVAEAAGTSKAMLNRSNTRIHESMKITGHVVESVRDGASSVSKLDASVRKIGEITQVIKGIADQTNLLALNAAIEAARAGDQGRGFAVVADEVRKLAALTADSTASITSMVSEFASIASEAVQKMDAAVGEVEVGMNAMRESVSGLDAIAKSSQKVDDMAKEIAHATGEQAAAGESIASAIEKISSVSNANANSVMQASDATSSLAVSAQKLRDLVARFDH